MSVKEKFLDYVRFDTQSDETSATIPSTEKQKTLGAHLVEEMQRIGIADARMDEMGYVYGTIPATAERGTTVGFIAHMDTYGGVSGENINTTMERVEKIMSSIVTAFEKQLDSLYAEEAMDISADITVFETLLKQEGFVDEDKQEQEEAKK